MLSSDRVDAYHLGHLGACNNSGNDGGDGDGERGDCATRSGSDCDRSQCHVKLPSAITCRARQHSLHLPHARLVQTIMSIPAGDATNTLDGVQDTVQSARTDQPLQPVTAPVQPTTAPVQPTTAPVKSVTAPVQPPQPTQPAQPIYPAMYSTPMGYYTSDGPLAGFKTADETQDAVKDEIKSFTVVCGTSDGSAWMDGIFDQQGITIKGANAVLRALKEKNLYVNDHWVLKSADRPEKVMYEPSVKIFNQVFSTINYEDSSSRKAEDTSNKHQVHADSSVSTKPDFLIIGKNHKFLPSNDGGSLYSQAIVVGDIKLDRSHEGVEKQRAQIGLYAR